uniref:ArsR/SmtB family transcription factor n=1 Tax=Paracoccus aminophilus TaxID=34003 RepID=UPI0005A0A8DB|nr:metalloregulator ArsR/SmtB family transcription factor [Paracoccus aminophilus]
MSIANPKAALYEQFAGVAKSLGNPQRLEIIEHLAQAPRSVEALAAKLSLPVANVSQHLQAMRRAGLLSTRRDGKFVIYHLSGDSVLAAFAAIRAVAEQQSAEVERVVRGWFDARDDAEPVSHEELSARMEADLVTVIDVRPADEFALGHLPGAINLPLQELVEDLRQDLEGHLGRLGARLGGQLGAGREIVAYCRGPWCVLSFEAVAMLRQHGLQARRLKDGLPEWRAAGYAVET